MKKNPTDESKGLTVGGSIINTASFVGLMGAATPQLACEPSSCLSLHLHLLIRAHDQTRLPRQVLPLLVKLEVT